jgi:uncharacterized protein YndB with AHSA1/START domain
MDINVLVSTCASLGKEVLMETDRVERTIEIEAPVERVWAVITESEHIGVWFGDGTPAKVDLTPGGVMIFDHAHHGRHLTTIVDVDAPHRFSFLWAAGFPGTQATTENSTLVEFTLEPIASGTLLKVTESGFDALEAMDIPAEMRDKVSIESHSAGWTEVIKRIDRHVRGEELPPLVSSE